ASAEWRAPEHVAGSDAFGGVVVSGEASGGRNRILFRVKSIRLRPPLGKESGSARPGRAELSPGQTILALVTPAPKPREPPAPRLRKPPAPPPRPPTLPLPPPEPPARTSAHRPRGRRSCAPSAGSRGSSRPGR